MNRREFLATAGATVVANTLPLPKPMSQEDALRAAKKLWPGSEITLRQRPATINSYPNALRVAKDNSYMEMCGDSWEHIFENYRTHQADERYRAMIGRCPYAEWFYKWQS